MIQLKYHLYKNRTHNPQTLFVPPQFYNNEGSAISMFHSNT